MCVYIIHVTFCGEKIKSQGTYFRIIIGQLKINTYIDLFENVLEANQLSTGSHIESRLNRIVISNILFN